VWPDLKRRATQHGGLEFLIPIVAGGALAAYSPELGIGTGGLTLAIAAIYRKNWRGWIVGGVVLAVALFFYWKNQKEPGSRKANWKTLVGRKWNDRGVFFRSHQLAFDSEKQGWYGTLQWVITMN